MRVLTPHTKRAGYFLNNSSSSQRQEADIALCTHCEKVILLQQWKGDGGWCGRCMAPICGPCADRMLIFGCEPFVRKIEAVFEAAIKLKQHRMIAGLDKQPSDYVPKLIVPVN